MIKYLQPWADGEEGLIECEAEKGELRGENGDTYGATGGGQDQVKSFFYKLLVTFAPWECDGKSVSSMPRSNFESAR